MNMPGHKPRRKIDIKARMQKAPIYAQHRPPKERVRDFDETLILHTPEEAIEEASRCIQCPNTPCKNACPVHNDIPRAIALLAAGEILAAAQVYRETNTIPEVCGRVCPRELCQEACTLNNINKPLDLRRLEAFVTDYQQQHHDIPLPQVPEQTGKKVAVIGAGPAGLTVAEYLVCQGHHIAIFDKHPGPGGLLLHGIPRFKLRRDIVQRKVEWLHKLGVQMHYNVTVGKDISIDTLLHNYNAVFMGVGTTKDSRPGLDGENLHGVYTASQLLNCAYRDPTMPPLECQAPLKVGPRVHILGGGDTAMDCIRTALRLPGVEKVTCYYRRSQAEMPAHDEEYQKAQEEGAEFVWLTCAKRFEGDGNGNLKAITYHRMELGKPDESGRRRPKAVAGSDFTVEVDTVVLAFGYQADDDFLGQIEGLRLRSRGLIDVENEATGQTHIEGLFAAGDVVRGPDLVVTAIAAAKQVAKAIDEYLK